MKYFNNNTNDKIKGKINKIRLTLVRLGNIVPKKYKNIFRKDLYEIENKKKLTKAQREKVYSNLIKLANTLDKKEHKYSDYDDMDYFGLRDVENLFDNTDDSDYYKPTLVKSSFEKNYKYYESRGDKDKKLSVRQCLYMIIPYLSDLINEQKNNRDRSNKWKIQLNMGVNFVFTNDTGEIRTFYVRSDNEEIRLGNETSETINKLIESF